MAAVALTVAYHVSFSLPNHRQRYTDTSTSLTSSSSPSSLTSSSFSSNYLLNIRYPCLSIISATERRNPHGCVVVASLPSSPSPSPQSRTTTSIQQLYVSGLSFRTTEESLVNAFKIFGELVEVNLVMDRIANRPRGFAFLRYATEEESRKAIEGMHGKFLDGRVIFVEVAKPRWEVRQSNKQSPRQ